MPDPEHRSNLDPPASSIGKLKVQARGRWLSAEFAGWVAVIYTFGAIWLYFDATTHRSNEGSSSTLLFPYLAAAGAYFSTCVWILTEGYFTSSRTATDNARKPVLLALGLFTLGVPVMLLTAVAGAPGANAVLALNCYLFPAYCNANPSWPWDWFKLPFNWIAAAGNSAALATLGFIAMRCKQVTVAAVAGKRLREIGPGIRTLHRLLVLASALLVTSTFSLFLLFAASEQLPSTALSETAAADDQSYYVLDCDRANGSTLRCMVKSPALNKVRSNAPSMALVAGIAFTGLLFILFTTASMAIDERIDELTIEELAKETFAGSVKSWREAEGFSEATATDKVLQAVALAAPAITGAITLAYSA